ncbi:MAG: hypothetical protein E6370_11980 [Clostridiales bacterium]|nr:hypothetical protein [Clostridiales bacterium]MDU6975028.1 hypothetical protein [Clostridiales bacterium]
MKKRGLILIGSILALLILLGGAGYLLYDRVSAYFVEETLVSQMTQELIAQTGIDLGEAGRVLTEEEKESFKAILNTKETSKEEGTESAENVQTQTQQGNTNSSTVEDTTMHETAKEKTQPVTTDDIKIAVEQQAKNIAKSIPTKDKSAMLNLVLSNLKSSDLNYLMGLALDGVSSSDLAQAKRIAMQSFNEEDLERVKEYYDTYKHLIP